MENFDQFQEEYFKPWPELPSPASNLQTKKHNKSKPKTTPDQAKSDEQNNQTDQNNKMLAPSEKSGSKFDIQKNQIDQNTEPSLGLQSVKPGLQERPKKPDRLPLQPIPIVQSVVSIRSAHTAKAVIKESAQPLQNKQQNRVQQNQQDRPNTIALQETHQIQTGHQGSIITQKLPINQGLSVPPTYKQPADTNRAVLQGQVQQVQNQQQNRIQANQQNLPSTSGLQWTHQFQTGHQGSIISQNLPINQGLSIPIPYQRQEDVIVNRAQRGQMSNVQIRPQGHFFDHVQPILQSQPSRSAHYQQEESIQGLQGQAVNLVQQVHHGFVNPAQSGQLGNEVQAGEQSFIIQGRAVNQFQQEQFPYQGHLGPAFQGQQGQAFYQNQQEGVAYPNRNNNQFIVRQSRFMKFLYCLSNAPYYYGNYRGRGRSGRGGISMYQGVRMPLPAAPVVAPPGFDVQHVIVPEVQDGLAHAQDVNEREPTHNV